MDSSSLPERLQRRPTYKGFVVPAFALIDARGVPDFKVLNTEVWLRDVRERLCGICSKMLGYWI